MTGISACTKYLLLGLMNELKILLCWGISTFLLCGLLLWFRRDYGDRSRYYLCFTWIVVALVFLVRLAAVEGGRPISGRILPPENMSGGLMLLLMLFLYPIEVINKSWFTFRRLLQLYSPDLDCDTPVCPSVLSGITLFF